MPEQKLGDFVVKGRLGRGGMATVYLAVNEKLKREVALKVLHPEFSADPDFVKLFIDEARKAARLQHPNIITIYSADRADKYYYIEMERLHGRDLKRELKEGGKLTIGRAVEIVIAVCDALDYAYAEGDIVAHRDIKPQNIMICTRGKHQNVPILTDFGISRAREDSGGFRTGTVLGTPEYMSPEQAEGRHVDFRTDIYALGVVLYEIVTGNVPFSAESAIATALMHVKEKAPVASNLNPDVPSGLDSIILKCMNKDPDERYAKVADFVEDLREYRDASGEVGEVGSAPAPTAVSVHSAKLEKLIVMDDEEKAESAPAAAPTAAKPTAGPRMAPAHRPMLYVNTMSLKLPVSGTAAMDVGNRGLGRMEGAVKASAPWISVESEKFSVQPGETVRIGVRAASLPPPESCTGFVDIESNGGTRRVSVAVDAVQLRDRSRRLAAADAAVAGALAGGYVLLGVAGAGGGGAIMYAAGGAMAALLVLAVVLRNPWIAAAGSLLALVPAWPVFDFVVDPVWTAMAMGLNFLPAALTAVVSRGLFEKRPSAWFLVGVTPLALWCGGQFALGAVKGAPFGALTQKPMSGFNIRAERLTPEELGLEEGAGEAAIYIEIKGERVNLRAGSGTNFAVVGSAARGERFEKAGDAPGWYKIMYKGGTAWVAKSVSAEAGR